MKTFTNFQLKFKSTKSTQPENLFSTNRILSKFDPIELDQMEKQKLLNRVDTKFLFETGQLPHILEEIQSDYALLDINNSSIQSYMTLYFDTHSFDNYFAHHNGKRPRFKIRMRKYLNSNDTFLEVKEKDNKNRTIKTRMGIQEITTRISPEHYQFISEVYTPGLVSLKSVMWNRYNRLTLVNKHSLERVTIDLNYNAFNQNGFISWNEFAIAEIKQNSRALNTSFYQALKRRHIKPVNFSKYCISMAILTPELKANKFKANIDIIKSSLQRSFNYAF